MCTFFEVRGAIKERGQFRVMPGVRLAGSARVSVSSDATGYAQ